MKDGELKTKNGNDPNYSDAEHAAEIDIKQDLDLSPTEDVADDLDEGELARFDNDGEKNYDMNEHSDVFRNAGDAYDKPPTDA